MNGCKFSPTMSAPLINPHSNPTASGTRTATGSTTQAEALKARCCKAAAVPSAESAMDEPTEMSIPPVMMTTVSPTAMMA